MIRHRVVGREVGRTARQFSSLLINFCRVTNYYERYQKRYHSFIWLSYCSFFSALRKNSCCLGLFYESVRCPEHLFVFSHNRDAPNENILFWLSAYRCSTVLLPPFVFFTGGKDSLGNDYRPPPIKIP